MVQDGMAPGEGIDILGVSPANNTHDRNAPADAGLQHHPVPACQPFIGQGQAAQPVILMGINACIVEHQIRADMAQHRLQMVSQHFQIGLISQVVLQPDIQITLLLADGKVLLAMH